jgi:hypothetical protein
LLLDTSQRGGVNYFRIWGVNYFGFGGSISVDYTADTFEAEAKIDIEAIARKIFDLDAKMAENDATIAGFCEELGISAPF